MTTDPARVTAYENALRGIAAAAIAGRRRANDMQVLQSMLADVEHHLSSLVALGYVPANTGAPVTVSGLALQADRPVLQRALTICPRCAAGNHSHDADETGRAVECPFQGVPGDLDSVCECPWRG